MLKKNKGFTLIEILVAAAILGSVLVTLSLLMGMTIRSSTEAKNRVIAGDLAQSGSDFFRQERNAVGFGNLEKAMQEITYCLNEINKSFLDDQGNVNSDFSIDNCGFGIEISGTSTQFKREAVVKQAADDLIKLEIRVTWQRDADEEAEISSSLQLRPH